MLQLQQFTHLPPHNPSSSSIHNKQKKAIFLSGFNLSGDKELFGFKKSRRKISPNAVGKDSEFEVDPDKAREALRKLDDQLQSLSEKKPNPPKIRGRKIKILRPQMKVHPVPRIRGNITLRYDVASVLAQANGCRQKKLRRLPHIFAKVLELPFHSDADVSIQETPDSLRFTAATDDISGEIRADAIEIYPGVTKVVVRGNGVVDFPGTEFELDLWLEV